MKIKNPFKKLNQDGFDHVFLGVFVVVLIAIAGSYLVFTSRAATVAQNIVNANGKCLNDQKAVKAQNNPIEEYTCAPNDTSGARKWTQKGATIVNANGYCLAALAKTSSSKVVIQKCTSAALQTWTVNAAAKTIVSKPSGLCLDIPGNVSTDKTLMQVYTCNGTNAQVWSFTSTSGTAPTISSFSASPASVSNGAATTLSWATTGNSCSVTPGGPTNSTAKSWKSAALSATTTYTLSCTLNSGPVATKTATVTVAGATTSSGDSKFGYSAPASQWDSRLANVGGPSHIKYRRIYYTSFTDSLSLVKTAEAAGMTPIISFKTGNWSWAQVASGAADADLQTMIKNLNAISGPKIVVIHHEPAKDGTDTDWANMQLHALPIVKAGASNVSVGVIGNGWWWTSGSNHLSDAALARYIPASLIAKIDFVGADTYQDVGSSETAGVKINNMVAWANRVGGVKALGIGEWNGTSAASITSTMNTIKSQPLVKWAAMWDNGAAGTIGAQLTGDRLAAFKAGIATTSQL